ncbi:hypothetical protein [Amycolatopsis sp. NPDC051903]|uniref:hypothetical protein n=1 Tax=Amycolatopsis sp. NPDC051903 TaxID=3363936 RepID=UPI00379D2A84
MPVISVIKDRAPSAVRIEEEGYRLAQLTPPGPHELAQFQLPLTISTQPAPVLATGEAVARLNLLRLPFLWLSECGVGRTWSGGRTGV